VEIGLQVVGPEIDHHLEQLAPAQQRAGIGYRPQMALQVAVGPAAGRFAGGAVGFELGQGGGRRRHSHTLGIGAVEAGDVSVARRVVDRLHVELSIDESRQIKAAHARQILRARAKADTIVRQPRQRWRRAGWGEASKSSRCPSLFQVANAVLGVLVIARQSSTRRKPSSPSRRRAFARGKIVNY
jgi:hypothetical protein